MIRRQAPPLFKLALAGWGLAGFGAGLLLVNLGQFRAPERQMPFPVERIATSQSDIHPIVLGSDSGLVVNYIKPDRTAVFDIMIGQLKAAMAESRQSTLCDQAARWKVWRASDSGPDGTAVYVFAVDPGLPKVDYRVSTVIAEAIRRNPDEFYRSLVDLYAARQNVINVASLWPSRRPPADRTWSRRLR